MTLPDNLASVRAAIGQAEAEAGRPAGSARLIAVSKTFDADAIRPAIAAGQRHFGENRVQESLEKWPSLKAEHPDVVLHLIGPLQTNKVNQAVGLFDVFHTVDREKLARALARAFTARQVNPACYIQVNIGEEPQKAGVAPSETDALAALCRDELNLNLVGLMCIPPAEEPPAPYFALLAKIAARNNLPRLSMGMSGDYETAVRMGATDIRVGSAIFGARR
ncbi:MAG: YggS family pyridoxal phosphate-dependent enzyme [Alphaproteobacteria bacterium]|nr:YggS family pyridoxal phosphate-dependent enzyme [Alphaproteobacteria bacterium]